MPFRELLEVGLEWRLNPDLVDIDRRPPREQNDYSLESQ